MSVKAVFIGMPGAGKTTVGGLVAQALGCEFKDSDDLIEETAGRTIPEIFAADGEKGFRAIEARVIQEALVGYDGVLSLGGGAVLTASTREALRGHPVFLLNADNDELVRRLTSSSIIRPLVRDDPEGRVATLRREREDLYRASARYTVESDGRPARRVARKVLSIIDQLEQLVVEVEDEPTGYDVVVGTGLGRDLRVACQGAGSIFVCYARRWRSARTRSWKFSDMTTRSSVSRCLRVRKRSLTSPLSVFGTPSVKPSWAATA
ncbi:shikimate kinase [Actinobaculum sp. 313]|uniref:shikimate kinase n=1 Tax=Actinobaculum sp. 313 TaxID=2495645 RepID=UPI001F0C5872|nr:shikimate kinase [Actinobaculum sp. 313]